MRWWSRALLGTALRTTVRATIVRPAIVLTGVGSVGNFGSTFHDLRGELPVSEDTYYISRSKEYIEGMVWHHSATTGQTIRSIAEFHVEVKKWPGIAYHAAIGHDGKIYLLNDFGTVSFHAQGYNRKTIGVVLIGNYHERRMTKEMKDAALLLQDYLREEYDLKYAWMHKETKSTHCPGKYADEFLRPILYGPRP
jgi:hypothetical protein